MINNESRLLDLLNNAKISHQEHKLLKQALYTKHSHWLRLFWLIINPYKRLSILTSLIIGITFILLLSYIGFKFSVLFLGLMSGNFNPNRHLNYQSILINLLIIWVSISSAFFIISKMLGGYNAKFIEFLAFTGFAKLPFFLIILLDSTAYWINPRLQTPWQYTNSILTTLVGNSLDFIAVILIFWHIILYFFAFKEASGLNHHRTWFGFVIAMVSINALLTIYLN